MTISAIAMGDIASRLVEIFALLFLCRIKRHGSPFCLTKLFMSIGAFEAREEEDRELPGRNEKSRDCCFPRGVRAYVSKAFEVKFRYLWMAGNAQGLAHSDIN